MRLEYDYVKALAIIVRHLPSERNDIVTKIITMHRYVAYDPFADFIPQYTANMAALLKTLAKMAR